MSKRWTGKVGGGDGDAHDEESFPEEDACIKSLRKDRYWSVQDPGSLPAQLE